MSRKFIPNGDQDFVTMAQCFANTIAKEPARFAVSQEDSDTLSAVVEKFRAAFNANAFGRRSTEKTHEKELARGEAEQIVRRIANMIRANKSVDSISKMLLKVRERPTRLKQQTVPQEPPRLVVDVMRWMPKPSVRTLLGVAAVAAGIAIYRQGRRTPSSNRPVGEGQSRWSQLFGDATRPYAGSRSSSA